MVPPAIVAYGQWRPRNLRSDATGISFRPASGTIHISVIKQPECQSQSPPKLFLTGFVLSGLWLERALCRSLSTEQLRDAMVVDLHHVGGFEPTPNHSVPPPKTKPDL